MSRKDKNWGSAINHKTVVFLLVVFSAFLYWTFTYQSNVGISGSKCTGLAGYSCTNISLYGEGGKLSFAMTQTTGSAQYNVQISCTTSSYIPQQNSFSNLSANNTLLSSQLKQINYITCYDSKQTVIENLSVGTSFQARVWLRYTNYDTVPNQTNPYVTVEALTISTKAT